MFSRQRYIFVPKMTDPVCQPISDPESYINVEIGVVALESPSAGSSVLIK